MLSCRCPSETFFDPRCCVWQVERRATAERSAAAADAAEAEAALDALRKQQAEAAEMLSSLQAQVTEEERRRAAGEAAAEERRQALERTNAELTVTSHVFSLGPICVGIAHTHLPARCRTRWARLSGALRLSTRRRPRRPQPCRRPCASSARKSWAASTSRKASSRAKEARTSWSRSRKRRQRCASLLDCWRCFCSMELTRLLPGRAQLGRVQSAVLGVHNEKSVLRW